MNLLSLVRDQRKYGREWLEEIRAEVGADLIGALAVRPDSHPDFLKGVKTFLPTGKAVVMFGQEYDSETMNLIKPPAKYAGGVKTGELLSPHVNRLNIEIDLAISRMVEILKKMGFRSISLPSRGMPMIMQKDWRTASSVVKAPISFTHVAEAAGMGTIGTHSLLITPEFGTRVRLAGLITEAPIETTTRPDPVDDCTHCLDCVNVCPVGAIEIPPNNRRYKINAATCKFYRDKVDNCGLCQKVCSYATGHSEVTSGPLVADENFMDRVAAYGADELVTTGLED